MPCVIGVWALGGFYLSLGPSLAAQLVRSQNLLWGGCVIALLFAILAAHPLRVLDVEQVVIRGRLVLGVLLGCDSPPDLTGIHAAVSALAGDLGLEAEITTGSDRAAPAGEPAARPRLR